MISRGWYCTSYVPNGSQNDTSLRRDLYIAMRKRGESEVK